MCQALFVQAWNKLTGAVFLCWVIGVVYMRVLASFGSLVAVVILGAAALGSPPRGAVILPAEGDAPKTPFLFSQRAGEFRTQLLIGLPVLAADRRLLGEVKDFIFSDKGGIGVVVGIGGVIGLGERNIALPFHLLRVERDASGRRFLIAAANSAELADAPEYWSERTPVEDFEHAAKAWVAQASEWAAQLAR